MLYPNCACMKLNFINGLAISIHLSSLPCSLPHDFESPLHAVSSCKAKITAKMSSIALPTYTGKIINEALFNEVSKSIPCVMLAFNRSRRASCLREEKSWSFAIEIKQFTPSCDRVPPDSRICLHCVNHQIYLINPRAVSLVR